MQAPIFLTFLILLCDAKLQRERPHQVNDLPANPTQSVEALKLLNIEHKSEKTSKIVDQYRVRSPRNVVRSRRETFDSKAYESGLIWAHSERLDDNGDLILRWVNTDTSVTFRVEAKTKGYVGVGFNNKRNMRGADLVVAWVDDKNGNAQILDCHGMEVQDNAEADEVQNYELITGYQNDTHTTVEFRRLLDTCDAQDFVIGEDTIQVLWALGPDGSDGELPKHVNSGARPLRLLQPVSKPTNIPLQSWDVRLYNLTIPNNMATLFWCKIFKVPELAKKHHIIGYEPLIDSRPIKNGVPVQEKQFLSPVHHMVVYECVEDPDKQAWNDWSESEGSFGPNKPREWSSCITPVAAWAMGSNGEFLPENVGIPLGPKSGVSYYMLEVHYDNQALHEVLDSSGIRIHYTPALRRHDAAILGSGIGVSALHVIPPKQEQYSTVGICSSSCTSNTMPEDGINIVSVLLHAHGAAKKISLRHVRGNSELPRISEENAYDAKYQQSRVVPGGTKFQRGDTLITECTYDSTNRDSPIFGGYSASQEMCLSFVLYYPRTQLAGCYSMTPVKEFFETFGVKEFHDISMVQVENLFLSSGSLDSLPQQLEIAQRPREDEALEADDQGVGLLKELRIKTPAEFADKTFVSHLTSMPWREPLLTRQVQRALKHGPHMTFCKKRDDTWGSPIEIQNFPNFTEVMSNEAGEKSCNFKSMHSPSVTMVDGSSSTHTAWTSIVALCLAILALH